MYPFEVPSVRFSAAILSTRRNNRNYPALGFRVKIARIVSVAVEAFLRIVKVARWYDLLKKVARTTNRRVHVYVCTYDRAM